MPVVARIFAGVNLIKHSTVSKSIPCMAQETGLTSKRTMPKKIGTHNGKFHCDEALGKAPTPLRMFDGIELAAVQRKDRLTP